MTNTEITKTVVGTAVGIGAYSITRSMIKALTIPAGGPIGKLLYFVGSVGIAFWISDMVQNHTEQTIDDASKAWKNAKASAQN